MVIRARSLFLAVAVASVLAGLATVSIPIHGAKKKDAAEKPEAQDDNWDVNKPPGTWTTIEIDTTETTWSDVDVSPDGRTLVFDMLGDLYTVPIEGGDATALTESIAWDFQPRFSPDGKRIAFVSDRAGGDNLWVMNADGSAARAVTEETEHLVHNPAWSPDGEYLAGKKGFTSTRSIPAGEIWLFHVGGGGGLQLTERPNGKQDQKTMAEPAFSPDGRYVYYSQDTTPGRTWQYNKDSTGQIFVIQRLDRVKGETDVFSGGPGGAVRPTPSPDGKWLAFVKRLPGLRSALYVKDLESGKERPVYDQLERDLQETNGSQGNASAMAWTPDSRSIVFWAAGKLRRIDVESGEAAVIPLRVKASKKIQPVLRVAVDAAPETFRTKMLRWAQRSPDGGRTVFQALGHLWIVEGDGAPRRLTAQNEHFEFHPSFSRDGAQVVYTTWSDEGLGSVRIVPAAGGAGREITREPGHYAEPRFSPDGSRVVYRKFTGGFLLSPLWSNEPGIYLADRDGGNARRLSRSGFDAHFGAASDRVYYSDTVEETQLVLKSVNLDGHDERTHVKGAEATEFRVAPDGRWLAFTENYNAYVAPFTPTGRTVDISGTMKSVPVRQVSARAGEFLHWSGDSSGLHWSHGPVLYTRQLREAFAFLAGDPDPEKLPEPVEQGIELGFEVAADRPTGRIALVGARVVTMRDAQNSREVIEDAVVIVSGERIEAVGPRGDVVIPEDARRFDVAGKTIVPGFIDVHAHGPQAREEITPQQNWTQYSNLAFGVTTIHDPSNDTTEIFAAAEMQRAGAIVAPRIFSTGTILYGAHVPGFTAKIDGLDDARFHVRRLRDVGAISVKSYQQPRRDQRQKVVAAGRELGVMVVPEGGAKFQHNMNEIVDGHTGIEHAIPLKTAYEDVLQLWEQSGVGYTPTLGVAYGGLSGEEYWYDRTEVWKDERLMAFSPRFVIEPRAMRRPTAPDDHYNHIIVAEFAKKLVDRGVSVQIGAHGQREGLAAHWEMWMLEQGGFSPWEALRSATISGAAYIGLDGDLGSIEPGKLADLVVIDGNPLERLRGSTSVLYTMLGGRLFEASSLNQIAPDATERRPFFFELEGGDTIHPATQHWLETTRERFGWAH